MNGDLSFIFEQNGINTLVTPDCNSGGNTNCPDVISGFTTLGEFNGSKYFYLMTMHNLLMHNNLLNKMEATSQSLMIKLKMILSNKVFPKWSILV